MHPPHSSVRIARVDRTGRSGRSRFVSAYSLSVSVSAMVPGQGWTGYPSARLVPLPVGRAVFLQRRPKQPVDTDPPNRALLRDGLASALGAVHVRRAGAWGIPPMHEADDQGLQSRFS
jgi:hypothetical protein